MHEENKRIYGHEAAGKNAYLLFEELSGFINTNANGWVDLRRTMKYAEDEDNHEYPPVYEVWWVPNQWKHLGRELVEGLFELGDRYRCRVDFKVRDGKMTAVFSDGGRHFQSN